MSNNKKGGIYGKGYYIALILCATAIGISGYMYYRNANNAETQLQEVVSADIAADEPQEDLAVVVIQPQQAQEQEDVPAVATEPAMQQTQSNTVLKTCAPVAGQTASAYAMDCLSYNETTRDWRVHNGVDFAAPAGTPVSAAADGQVYTVYEDDRMGMTVVIRHEGGYTTKYSSLSPDVAVSAGQEVSMGQTIGAVGTSALLENALGDHVHFSVTKNDGDIDPMEFLD